MDGLDCMDWKDLFELVWVDWAMGLAWIGLG